MAHAGSALANNPVTVGNIFHVSGGDFSPSSQKNRSVGLLNVWPKCTLAVRRMLPSGEPW